VIWIPTIEYILKLFKEKIGDPILIHQGRLVSTLDKVQWGIPYQQKPDIWDRATILYKDIVEGNYFYDGNKRIGLLTVFLFLDNNGYDFITSDDDAYEMTIQVAQGLKSYKEIKDWFRKNTKEFSIGTKGYESKRNLQKT